LGAIAKPSCFTSVNSDRDRSTALQRLEERMQRFQHLGGMAAIALTALGLSACYPPPPGTVAVAPPDVSTALPPQPPPYYVPPTAATTPPYAPTGAVQPYGPTTLPGAAIPSNAGTTFVSVAPFAPPPPQVESPPAPPSPLAVWQPGHWRWSGGQYVWVPGRYVQRPTSSANWVPGYWQQGPNGWIWTEGRWA
jgi:hypothetical protein